jgi:hypothetical protein
MAADASLRCCRPYLLHSNHVMGFDYDPSGACILRQGRGIEPVFFPVILNLHLAIAERDIAKPFYRYAKIIA